MAPQKKKQPTPGYCRWCCSCCCTGFSIWCICFGLSWPAALDNKLQAAIYKGGIADKAEKDYTGVTDTNRKHNLNGVFLKYHFYNMTNPVAVMNGEAPKIKKLGPYVFQKYTTEHNIRFFDSKKIRASRMIGEMQYMPGYSCGTCRLSDRVVGAQNILSMWFLGRKCKGDASKTGSGGANEAFKHCGRIAQFGLFTPHTVEQLMWGFKEWNMVVIRVNNGHHTCPTHLPTCNDAAVRKQYDGTGQYGANLDGVRMKETIQYSGYENEGCKLPFEYKRHKIICPKGMSLGIARKSFGIEKFGKRAPPAVDINQEGKYGPAFDYDVHKKDVKAKTCSVWKDKQGNCTDSYADWVKATTSNFYKWYDDTPFDTSDDKTLDTGFKMDDASKPCKWDGSTNNIAGCPHMEQVKSFVVGHGMFHPDRMNNKDNPPLPHFGIMEQRQLELKFQGNNLVHGIKGKKYTIDEKHYKASHDNAKYGMPVSGAPYEMFPGSGVLPLQKIIDVPFFLTRPHWYGGGSQMIQWHKELGTRLPTQSSDEWSITYEPVTGLPVTGSLQYQFNTMYIPSNMNIHSGDIANTPVQYNYTNLTLEAGHFAGEKANLAKIGAFRGCGGYKGTEGCPMMVPYWIMELEIRFTPFVLEKIKRLLGVLKTVGMLKALMRFWMYGGITGIVCVFGCLSYHYFGSGKR